jgi:dTDP-4-dehydrorhamnose reductase
MRRVLVIGAQGLVGSHLMRECNRHWATAGTTHRSAKPPHRQLDIQQSSAVSDFIQQLEPAVIFHTAALTHVDHCETHADESHAVNVEGTRAVLEAAAQVSATVVFFSSDYVFDGTAGPYAEDDTPNPLNVYGQHKLAAEELVLKTGSQHLVIRTTGVFGWELKGNNFVARLVQSLNQRQPVSIPADQISTPTYALYLAKAIVQLVQRQLGGMYHVAGSDVLSRFAFAKQVAQVFGLDEKLLQSESTTALDQTAKRPLHSGLKNLKLSAAIELPPVTCLQALTHMQSHRPADLPAEPAP